MRGRVALVTITAPGGEFSRVQAAEWNLGESVSWRRFDGRIRREMWLRHGVPPPRRLAWVAQRQGRGLDHLHLVFWCLNSDHEERIRWWIEIYRQLHLDYGFGFVDDPFHVRRNRRTGKLQNMIFSHGDVAGVYLGAYLAGGQLERFVAASDRSWRPYWISPVLMARSGWSLERCRWIRQAWLISRGEWVADMTPLARLVTRLPTWWHDRDHRAWAMAVLGWDGVVGSLAPDLCVTA